MSYDSLLTAVCVFLFIQHVFSTVTLAQFRKRIEALEQAERLRKVQS